MKYRNDEDLHFEVIGAGELEIGQHAWAVCGCEFGVSVGVSWGTHGFAGGVIPREQAAILRDHLIEILAEPQPDASVAFYGSGPKPVWQSLIEPIIVGEAT